MIPTRGSQVRVLPSPQLIFKEGQMNITEYLLYWEGKMHDIYDSLEEAEHWVKIYREYYKHVSFSLRKREIKETVLDIRREK